MYGKDSGGSVGTAQVTHHTFEPDDNDFLLCCYCGARRGAAVHGREETGGVKYDTDKPAMALIPPKAIMEVGRALNYGAKKYAPENWRKFSDGRKRYIAAALRHLFQALDGEYLDPESKLPHLAHAATSVLFALEKELEGEK